METQLPLAPGIGGALAFAIAYLLTCLPLKIVGAARYVGPLSQKLTFFTVVPFYSPRSWQRSPLLQREHLRFAARRLHGLGPIVGGGEALLHAHKAAVAAGADATA